MHPCSRASRATALFEELGVALSADDAESYERTVERVRSQLGGDFERVRAEGSALDFDAAVALALEVRDARGSVMRRRRRVAPAALPKRRFLGIERH